MIFKKEYEPDTPKNREYYLRRAIMKTQAKIWDTEIGIETAKEGRETLRSAYDQVCDGIKAHDEIIEKKMKDLGLGIERKKDLEEIRQDPGDLSGLNPTERGKYEENANQETRRMRRNWLEQRTDNKIKKRGEQINNLIGEIERKQDKESEVNRVYEQMFGKWNEALGQRVEGIDQQIEKMKNEIDALRAFQTLVRKMILQNKEYYGKK